MLIIADKKIPAQAKENLSAYGEIVELYTEGITYNAISGHPDIFFCKVKSNLITAQNLPLFYKDILDKHNIAYVSGNTEINETYPQSAAYNAAAEDVLIHRLDITDAKILSLAADMEKINVTQGYCRCSLLPLKQWHYITSDAGICKSLNAERMIAEYVDPDGILLPGFKNGFFGGACGVYEDKVFIIGSLKYLKDGSRVREFLSNLDYQIIELYDGPFFDGGSILFI